MSYQCANHVCAREVDLARVSAVVCPLCRGPVYCSDACRQTDWVKHACPNAVVSANASIVPMRQYAWEDELDPALLEAELAADPVHHPMLQQHSVTHYGGDNRVTTTTFPALIGAVAPRGLRMDLKGGTVRGMPPPAGIAERGYILTVEQQGYRGNAKSTAVFMGKVREDAIYKGNDSERMQALFGGGEGSLFDRTLMKVFNRVSKDSRIILWPDASKQPATEFDLEGALKITLRIEGVTPDVASIETTYKLRPMGRLTQAVAKGFKRRMRAKFPDGAIKAMTQYSAEAMGARAVLIFQIDAGAKRAFLRDIEFAFSENDAFLAAPPTDQSAFSEREAQLMAYSKAQPADGPSASQYFSDEQMDNMRALSLTGQSVSAQLTVDPASLEQMTGLVMAMETRALQPSKNAELYARVGATLRNYVRDLNDKRSGEIDEDSIPDEVHTATRLAVGALLSECQ